MASDELWMRVGSREALGNSRGYALDRKKPWGIPGVMPWIVGSLREFALCISYCVHIAFTLRSIAFTIRGHCVCIAFAIFSIAFAFIYCVHLLRLRTCLVKFIAFEFLRSLRLRLRLCLRIAFAFTRH